MSIKEANNRLGFYPRAVAKELVVQKMEDELLVYNLQTNQAMCLNQTAALVWESCDGKSSASEIAEKLDKMFKGGAIHEELVTLAVMELKEKGLLENGEEMPNKFEGLSRREIVRKVGFASLVALPIVSSITAPQAAAATTACVEDFATRGRCAAASIPDCTLDCANGNYIDPPTRVCCNRDNPGTHSTSRCLQQSDGSFECDCTCSVPIS